MSNTRKPTGAKPAADTAPAAAEDQDVAVNTDATADDLDRELAELREALEAKRAAEADPRRVEIAKLRAELEGGDPRDATIAALRSQLQERTATPQGEAEELRKALSALQEKVQQMQSGQGLVPVPDAKGPDPYLYGARTAAGETVFLQHPQATHHWSADLGDVPITSVWTLSPEMRPQAEQWAREYASAAAERAHAGAH